MKAGDEVWVKGKITSVGPRGPRVAFRVAARVGSSYPGSSSTNTVLDGVVVRVTEVPAEDVKLTGPGTLMRSTNSGLESEGSNEARVRALVEREGWTLSLLHGPGEHVRVVLSLGEGDIAGRSHIGRELAFGSALQLLGLALAAGQKDAPA